MLISTSAHITKVQPCELERALDYISLKHTSHPCKHESIKKLDEEMLFLGISDFSINWIFFVSMLYIFLIGQKKCGFLSLLVLFCFVSFFKIVVSIPCEHCFEYDLRVIINVFFIDSSSCVRFLHCNGILLHRRGLQRSQ